MATSPLRAYWTSGMSITKARPGPLRRPFSCAQHSVKAPPLGQALQLVLAAVLELDPGARDKVLHRSRDEDLTRPRRCSDARPDVHGDAGHLLAEDLALSG